MRFSLRLYCFLVAAFISLQFSAAAQNQPTTRILFIFDASNSMNGSWQSGHKIDIAQKLLSQALDSLSSVDNLQLALRVYGHQYSYLQGQNCNDTKLEVPFGYKNTAAIKAKLRQIVPKGTTPIAQTLEKAGGDFPECANCRNIIILITDGIEECNGDPCAISMMLQQKGIILKPFVIGIGLDMQFKKSFECMGYYYDASNEKTFQEALGVVISQAINNTTAQVNLLDLQGNPRETNVALTFDDHYSHRNYYNFVHTLNGKGDPDTLKIDPVPIYDLTVHTIPPVHKDSIYLSPGKHTIIGVDASQGDLYLRASALAKTESVQAIIRKAGENQTLHVQQVNATERYLIGFYDVEVLTFPRTFINNVAIKQSHTTTLDIPSPGIASFLFNTTGYGSILHRVNGKLEWVYTIPTDVDRITLKLQPGEYILVFRSKSATDTYFSIEKEFKIISGQSLTINPFK